MSDVDSKTLTELRQLEADELAAADRIYDHAKNEGRVDPETGEGLPSEAEADKIDEHMARAGDYRRQINHRERARKQIEARENARSAQVAGAGQIGRRPDTDPDAAGDRPGSSPDRVPAVARDKDREARHGFENFSEFLSCVQHASYVGGTVDPRLRIGAVTTGGASTYSGPDGGYLSPPAFSERIWEGVMDGSDPVNLVARCDTQPMTKRRLVLNADATTSQADGSRDGGLLFYWKEEGGSPTATKPTFRQLELKLKKLMGLTYMTDELLEDAPALTNYLERKVGKGIRYMVNRSIVRGAGVGSPLGIINSGGIVTVTVETGQTSNDTLLSENVDKMYAHLQNKMGAVWLVHQSVQPALQKLGRTVGVGGVPAYMPPGGLSQAPYGTLKGLPVIECEYCSGANTTGDIILANLSGYVVGNGSRGLRSDSSIHVAFTTDEMAFRFIIEIDGQPWRAAPLTLEQGSWDVADFVLLGTRS